MKLNLSLILIVVCAVASQAQKAADKVKVPDDKALIAAQQRILKKQILVDDLDNQAKNVELASTRIFARTMLAKWLWKDGKDETGRAELIVSRAVEELYEKKIEIPNSFFLSADLFTLLELNAPETAKKLRAKYKVDKTDDLLNAFSLLNKPGGDKIAADKIKSALDNGENELNTTNFMLHELRDLKSPEFLALLSYIVVLEETGKNSFAPEALVWITDYFSDATVPLELKTRFYRIVLGKARNAVQSANANGITSADSLLYAVLPDINRNAPELAGEATALKVILSAKTSQWTRESQERNERIRESADKLTALIAEAEKTDSKDIKQGLYVQAALLASKQEKFQFAVDLYDKSLENISADEFPKPEMRYLYHDQQLNEIVKAALAKNDIESAEYATKKIIVELSKIGALCNTAIYFVENKDSASASSVYEEALRIVRKEDHLTAKFYQLSHLISAAQTVDRDRVSEVITLAAKTIDSLPALNPEDKPGSDNFNNYVSTIMAINYNVNDVMRELIKKNRSEANDFAIRINRKDVKLIADVVLAINSFDAEKKQLNAK